MSIGLERMITHFRGVGEIPPRRGTAAVAAIHCVNFARAIVGDRVASGDVANLKSPQVFDTVYDQVRGAKFSEVLAR